MVYAHNLLISLAANNKNLAFSSIEITHFTYNKYDFLSNATATALSKTS